MADPATTLSIVLGVVLCGLVTIFLRSYSQHSGKNSGARLPKGSFGWPIIGETIALGQDPLGFAISHRQMYGSIFKSSLVMYKSIVGTTPEFAKFVLSNPALFPVIYPKSVEYLIPTLIQSVNRPEHKTVKRYFVKLGHADSLQNMTNTLESIIVEHLASWEGEGLVVGSKVVDKLIADTSSYIAFGIKNIRHTEEGRLALKNLITAFESIYSLPMNLPGTTHNKALKAVKSVKLYLHSILQQRKSQEDTNSDMVRILIDAAQEPEVTHLDDESIVENMIGTWIAAFKTTATTLTWSLKFILDYPNVLKRIQAEQQEILTSKDLSVAGPNLTLQDTKKMVYTLKFFQEVQRTISIASFVMRKAAQEVVFDGFLIPKGWGVYPMFNFVHNDPANYEDPSTFNPDRFDAPPKGSTYLGFSNGQHRCPGEEIAKLDTLIFIHHLTTKYIYESVGPDLGMRHKGHPEIIGGYPIKIR